jgi:hypothetical protein
VHHAAVSGGAETGVARLSDALRGRIARLDGPSRRFLEVLAVAGAPIPLKIAASASELSLGEAGRQILPLRHERLARANGTRAADRVEPFHDRVREALLAGLDETSRRDTHARIADALEGAEAGLRDPHLLVRHLEAAGFPGRAAAEAERNAAGLEDQLAFDQAAEMYAIALRLGQPGDDDRRRLHARRGEALANSGRCREAAEAFLAAAEGADDAMRLDFRRRAAEQNLISGHIELGLEQLRAVLADAGLALPSTPTRALATLLWQRARLKMRRLRWRPRDRSRIAPRDLERLDLHRSVALGLSFVDNIRGAGFQTRGLILAHKLGEGSHFARAILLEAGYRAVQGSRYRAGLEPLLLEGRRVAEEIGDPHLMAWAKGVTGTCEYLTGRFAESTDTLREAEQEWLARPGGTWELNSLRILLLLSLRRTGMFNELSRLYDAYRRDAVRRGDRLAETTISRALSHVWLVRDRPDHARDELVRSSWTSETGFLHLQNWYEIELYTGDLANTRARHGDALAKVERSLLMRIQLVRTSYWCLIGRLALAEPTDTGAVADPISCARKLESERVPYATIWGRLLRAGDAARRGDRARAMQLLREVVLLGEEHRLLSLVAAARRRLGGLLSAADGRPLVDTADAWFAAEGVQRPERVVDLLAPGFAARTASA